LFGVVIGTVLIVSLGEVRIRALDLHKALAANRLVAAPGVIQVWRISQEADGAFRCILVQKDL
jgi:hypothetical protein